MKIGGLEFKNKQGAKEGILETHRCQECLGKELPEGRFCLGCDGFRWISSVESSYEDFTPEFKRSNKVVTQFYNDLDGNKFGEWSEADKLGSSDSSSKGGLGAPHEYDDGSGSGAGAGDQNQEKSSSKLLNFLFKALRFLLALALILALLWLLFNGLNFSKKESQATQEEPIAKKEKKPKKKKVKAPKSYPQVDKRPNSGFGPGIDPFKWLKEYNQVSYKSLKDNKGLQSFMKKNLVKGKKNQNLYKMSEKGVFHLCKDFGANQNKCRDEWFKSKKVRHTFIKKALEQYKLNGDNSFE